MAAIRADHIDIHAFRALAELELYETQLKRFVAGARDAGVRRGVRERLDTLRRCCAGCAGLTVPWLDLMISHFDLLMRLDEAAQAHVAPDEEQVAQALRRHEASLRELASACRRKLLARSVVGTRESLSRIRRAARARGIADGVRDST